MSIDYLLGWTQSDSTRKDSILLRRAFIDICGGNIIDGVLLAQVVYWHTPQKSGESRLEIERDGHLWLAKNYADWWEECRVPEGTARDSIRRLVALGLLIKRIWFYQSKKMPHLRIDPARFKELVEAVNAGTIEEARQRILNDGSQRIQGKTKRWEPTDTNVGSQRIQTLGANGYALYKKDSSETTSETTSKTTSSSTESDDSQERPPWLPEDEWLMDEIKQAFGLTEDLQAKLLTRPVEDVIALALRARRKGKDPAALFVTIVAKEQLPTDDERAAAAVARTLKTLDLEAIDRTLRQREYDALNQQASQMAREMDAVVVDEPQASAEARPADDTPDPGEAEDLDACPGDGGLSWRDIWSATLMQLKAQLSRESYGWLESSRAVGIAGDVLTVQVRHVAAKHILEQTHMQQLVARAVEPLAGQAMRVVYEEAPRFTRNGNGSRA